tara:strand:- start:78 stop:254 length:177 start_codon:yes stop_codon:yes gene_type:complete
MNELRFDGEFCGDHADDEVLSPFDWDCVEVDDVDSEADWNDERQPDEAQEWYDFDPDC